MTTTTLASTDHDLEPTVLLAVLDHLAGGKPPVVTATITRLDAALVEALAAAHHHDRGRLTKAAHDLRRNIVDQAVALPDRTPAPTPKPAAAPAAAAGHPTLVDVPLGSLHPDPNNPRDDVGDVTELANSMAAAGLIQPVIARRDTDTGRLVLVAGHRRLAAAQQLGWEKITTVVRRDMRPDRVLAAMLIENSQRTDLDPIEEARALRRLAGDNDTRSHAELAAMIGRTQVHVSGRLALLALPVEEQEQLRAKQMTLGDAIRRGRTAAGNVRPPNSTGHPHLGADHDLATKARARCNRLAHKKGGRNSVGGLACGQCWESVIRADERQHLHDVSNQQGRCVLCDTTHNA